MKLIKKIKVDKLIYGFQNLTVTILPVANTQDTTYNRWTSLGLYFNLTKINRMTLPSFNLLEKNSY
jgi:hypothetical protein